MGAEVNERVAGRSREKSESVLLVRGKNLSCRSPCLARAALRFPMVSARHRAARDLRWAAKMCGLPDAVWLTLRVAMCLERKGAMTEY